LKAWTSEQISSEISRSFDAIMSNESVLNQAMPDFFRAYITSGNYPKEVRPLLRDFIVYMLADHLSDTSYWSAKDSNEIYLLEIGKLASSPPI
ncbi:hypothetical protein C1882_28730, partial [Pseudomonas sp. FW305-E2]|uniref:hypothetical protein n=1 Tax=Pseudomonas sp. FW305-E2 TaxID=2075558 RepID=UPI000CD386A3